MIRLESPSLVVNHSESNMYLQMDHMVDVTPSWSIGYIINRIAAKGSPQKPLRNVVINCHGLPAYLFVGVGIPQNRTHLFRRLRGRVRKIWLYACSPAAFRQGLQFCASIARAADCYVLASPDIQWESAVEMQGLPHNCLDTFEGKLMSFAPDGRVNWTRTYPRGAPNPS